MRWITYDHLHLDRVATAWLIVRFIDPSARIDYVTRTDTTDASDAITFGIPGVGVGAHDEHDTGFGKMLRLAGLEDPALISMERMIHAGVAQALDHDNPSGLSQSEEVVGRALDFIGSGFGHLLADAENLQASLPLYDALYLVAQEQLLSDDVRAQADALPWLDRRAAIAQHLTPAPTTPDPAPLQRVVTTLLPGVRTASTTIPRPPATKVIGVGLNYRKHAEEIGVPIPTVPTIFAHFPSAIIGPDDAIVLPDPTIDAAIDYEGELAVVIGKRAKDVAVSDALDIVAGYCCANDISARTMQFADGSGQFTLAKSLDTFDSVGAMTPAAGIDPQNLGIRTILNGEVVQESTTAEMIFTIAELIAIISRTATLEPGDIILTGTPAGVGTSRQPPVYLRHGDVITVEVEGLEPLTNPVVAHQQ